MGGMPYPMPMPMPMPIPMPMPMPMQCHSQCQAPPCHQPCPQPCQQHSQPCHQPCPPPCHPHPQSCQQQPSSSPAPVSPPAERPPDVIAQAQVQEEDAVDEKEDKPDDKKAQKFSKFSIVSIIMVSLALIFGAACVLKTYEAYDGRTDGFFRLVDRVEDRMLDLAGEHYGDENVQRLADRADRVQDRTVALGTGSTSLLLFAVATLCSFAAGFRHRAKGKQEQGCGDGFLIASWIMFALTFLNALIILVLAFDEDTRIYPELVWTAMIGSVVAWLLMFGYSEMARRTYKR